ncbi:MAG: SHOCT domain-containing protein [Bacteroidia bacterium]
MSFDGANTIWRKYGLQAIRVNVNCVLFACGFGGANNFDVYIEDVIATCEITDCNTANNQTAVSQPTGDKFDELKKLKALLDSGAITKTEYDEQKKKLLAQ